MVYANNGAEMLACWIRLVIMAAIIVVGWPTKNRSGNILSRLSTIDPLKEKKTEKKKTKQNQLAL